MSVGSRATVDEIIARLSDSSEPSPRQGKARKPRPPQPMLALPPPTLLLRLLVFCAVLTLAIALCGMAWFSLRGGEFAAQVREWRIARSMPQPLPPPRDLLDPQRFAHALALREPEAQRLHAARAAALAAAGHDHHAVEAWAAAQAIAPTRMPSEQTVAWGAALVRLGRYRDAQTVLTGMSWVSLGESDRQRALDLLGRCHLARQIRPGGGLPAASGM